jgi:hypothetical protein
MLSSDVIESAEIKVGIAGSMMTDKNDLDEEVYD